MQKTTIAIDTANGVASPGMVITSTSPPNQFFFNTSGPTGNPQNGQRQTYLGITALGLIPYQTYKVTYTLVTNTNGGAGVGFFPENYGYNNTLYGLYPQIVSQATQVL